MKSQFITKTHSTQQTMMYSRMFPSDRKDEAEEEEEVDSKSIIQRIIEFY
jgi:hypothetical protein